MNGNKHINKELLSIYDENREEIDNRLKTFESSFKNSGDEKIFRELCFCILSSGVGPRIAQKSLDAIRDELWDGSAPEMSDILQGIHKYPDKVSYLTSTRDYLKAEYGFKLRELIQQFDNKIERRDFFANNKNIKGLGYAQASHFLRNLGFRGYAILDRNNCRSLNELGLTETTKPPGSRNKYLETEKIMENFAKELGIGIDELDFVLWFRKRGYIPK